MNVFVGYAERASSETLREHWARILTGEIRKPGSFSFQTLYLMSILDKHLAEVIERTCPAVMMGSFVCTGPFSKGGRFQDLLDLNEVGFLQLTGAHEDYKYPDHGRLLLRFKQHGIVVHGIPGNEVHLAAAFLTRAGRELLSIVGYQDDLDLIREIASLFRRGGGFIQGGGIDRIELVEMTRVLSDSDEYRVIETLWNNPNVAPE